MVVKYILCRYLATEMHTGTLYQLIEGTSKIISGAAIMDDVDILHCYLKTNCVSFSEEKIGSQTAR